MLLEVTGLVALCSDEPDVLVGARLGSPLVLGVGEGENFSFRCFTNYSIYKKCYLFDDGDLVKLKTIIMKLEELVIIQK